MPTYKPARHRYLATCGDINPAEHGGGYLIRVYPDGQPSYVSLYCVEWESDDDNATGYLYEADVRDRDILKAHSWIDVDAMIASMGNDTDRADWIRQARGTYLERARCLYDIASYYGWQNLDSYPIRVTRDDIRKRWAREGVGRKAHYLPGV